MQHAMNGAARNMGKELSAVNELHYARHVIHRIKKARGRHHVFSDESERGFGIGFAVRNGWL